MAPCLQLMSETCSCFQMKSQYSMDSELFVFERTVKAWGSEYVQNIRTTVCTCYKAISLHTLQDKQDYCLHMLEGNKTYSLHTLQANQDCCLHMLQGNYFYCWHTISLTFSFQLHIATCILPPSHQPLHNNLLLPHTDPLDGSTFVIFVTFVSGSDCFW